MQTKLSKTLSSLLVATMLCNLGQISAKAEESSTNNNQQFCTDELDQNCLLNTVDLSEEPSTEEQMKFITVPENLKLTESSGNATIGKIIVSASAVEIGVEVEGTIQYVHTGNDLVVEGTYGDLTLSVLSEEKDGTKTATFSYIDPSFEEEKGKKIDKYGQLSEGVMQNETFKIVIRDVNKNVNKKDLIIHVTGTNDAPRIIETPKLNVGMIKGTKVEGTLIFYDVDSSDIVTFTINDDDNKKVSEGMQVEGNYGTFTLNKIDQNGKPGYYGWKITYEYTKEEASSDEIMSD